MIDVGSTLDTIKTALAVLEQFVTAEYEPSYRAHNDELLSAVMHSSIPRVAFLTFKRNVKPYVKSRVLQLIASLCVDELEVSLDPIQPTDHLCCPAINP